MAQANYTPISLYYSTNAAAVPLASNLTNGELAINIATGRLYYKNSSGTVVVLADGNTASLAVPVRPSQGGTGIINNDASTIKITGNFATNLTVTAATDVTLPTSGTLATLSGNETLSNKTLSNVTGNNITFTNLTATTVTLRGGNSNAMTQSNVSIVSGSANAITITNSTITSATIDGGTSNGQSYSNVTILSGSANAVSLNNVTINNGQVNGYTEGITSGYVNTGSAYTINIANSTVITANLSATCTFTMPTAAAGKSFILFLKTGAGTNTATFTNVKWVGNTAPTITATANRMDILTFAADGTNWYGNYAQNYNPN